MDNKNNNYIFVDFSNISIGFYNYVEKKYRIANPKINYKKLFSIMENKKTFKKKILVGSKNKKESDEIINTFRNYGYDVFILERNNNREICVDELLHGKIMETLLYSNEPGNIIICTGDGKTSDYTDNSFYKICIKALTMKWKITIISWKNQLNKNYILGIELYNILKDTNIKKHYKILYLDNYAEEIIN